MRKIIASTYSTLDGFIDNPHLWSFDHFTEEAGKHAFDQLFACDALLMGRVTYEGFVQAWPSRAGDPFADRVNSMAKYVVSSTMDEAEWENTTVIKGENLVEEITRLKQEPGDDILIYGCGQLTDALLEAGLMDEYRIWVYPVVLGKGERLWREGISAKLEMVDSKIFDSGVAILSYAPTD
ncbi:dihydrofolate reductase family protein [Nonomuraea sp. NPDC046570]|uniref:dihydrofolate reductase family protein n=1 Tax=Nonomuraea sp. NPDC046570 TaxID=3155255 RepID=UPI003407D8DC